MKLFNLYLRTTVLFTYLDKKNWFCVLQMENLFGLAFKTDPVSVQVFNMNEILLNRILRTLTKNFPL